LAVVTTGINTWWKGTGR